MADAPTTPPVNEGFLHSLATSLGVDPDAVKQAAKAIYAHPIDTAKVVGSEAASEISDAAAHPIQTAKEIGKGVLTSITNPDAQGTAKARIAQPGVANKTAGAIEYLESGIPLVGGNLAKSEEQAAKGNLAGAAGTTLGTIAPMLLETEPIQTTKTHLAETGKTLVEGAKEGLQRATNAKAPEGSLEAGFAKIGGKKIGEAPQGSHAGGGVASEEELARPGRFVKVSKSGALTDQGKTPDFNLKPGEAGYQVMPDGTAEVRAGQESPVHKAAIDRYSKEVFPTPKPEYEQSLAKQGNLPGQKVNMAPAYGETGQYVGGLVNRSGLKERTTGNPDIDQHIRSAGGIPAGTSLGDQVLFHDPATGSTLSLPAKDVNSPAAVRDQIIASRAKYTEAAAKSFIEQAPEGKLAADDPRAKGVKHLVENNGGIFRGMQVDKAGDKRVGMLYFDVPEDRVSGKKNVTAAISISQATPEAIRAKIDAMAAQHNPAKKN